MTVDYDRLPDTSNTEVSDGLSDQVEEVATALASVRYEDTQGTTSSYPRFTDC